MSGVTFVAPQTASGTSTSPSVVASGLTAGQPLVLIISCDATGGLLYFPTSVTDTNGFTWTLAVSETDAAADVRGINVFIGTGGAGGTSTTVSAVFSAAVPWTMTAVGCIGATTASGSGAIQAFCNSTDASAGTTITSGSATPNFGLGGAIYACRSGATITTAPGSPWTSTISGPQAVSLYPSPPVAPLSTTWDTATSQTWVSAGIIVLGFTAPSAPTLQSPTNAAYEDVTGASVTFDALYNSTDDLPMNAYALRIKTSAGSYNYWNAGTSALQSGIVWNTDSVPVGASWSLVVPSAVLTDGNVYNWSMASQESGESLQGAFASDFTFTAQALPSSLTVTAPTGTVTSTNEPAVAWTVTLPPGAAQTAYEIIVESGAYATTPGSGTQIWTSGVISSSSASVPVGVPLPGVVTYRAFVQVTETGGEISGWAYNTFTMAADVPAVPVFTAVPGNDSTTGAPMVTLTLTGNDNQLTANQSSLESNVATGWTANV